jgi:site-specific recombinase XerD
MTLSKAVNLFLQEVRVSKAKATATAYESDLNRLIALSGMNTVLAFTPDLVRLYFTTESQRGNGMSTLHRKLATIREFARWGVRHGLWTVDPTVHFPTIKRPKHLPRPFQDEEVARLLVLDLSPMERTLRAVLFGSGLRATPICGLRVGDVNETPPQLRAFVKGSKVQVVPIPPELRDLIVSYALALGRLKPQEYLFRQRRSGKPITRRELEDMTHRWGLAASVPDCLPHRFRHTYATRLLRAGVDIRLVKDLLGHEDIKSTVVYTEVTDAALSDAVLRLSWKLDGSK